MPTPATSLSAPAAQASNPNLIYVPYFYVAVSAAMSGNASSQIPLVLDDDYDFDLHSITVSSTLDDPDDQRPNFFSVQITDKNSSRIWASDRVPEAAMVSGYDLNRPVRLASRSNLSFDFLNLSASANTATVVLHGFKVVARTSSTTFSPSGMSASGVRQQMNYVFLPYDYVATGPSLGGNASGLTPLVLDQDADFELHAITAVSTVDDPINGRPNNFSVLITDKNNDRIWSSARIPQVSFIPDYTLARPVLISRRSNLNFDFLNLSASTNVPTVILHGLKVLGL